MIQVIIWSIILLPVAESGHISHLNVCHLKQTIPVLILQLHDVKDTLHTPGHAGLDEVLVEVRQLLEVAVLAPHGLGDHLGQLHGGNGGTQPPIAAQHVNTGLDQPDGFTEDQLCILLQLGTQLDPAQMGL